jgi:penicillin-binding protein 1C
VAVKTGTARGFASTSALGVTAELTVAAWAGNPDGRPTSGLSAMTAAAPLLREALLLAADGRALTLPEAPTSLEETEVCPVSGMAPGPECPHRKLERLTPTQVPRESCTWHRRVGEHVVTLYPPEVVRWRERMGLAAR